MARKTEVSAPAAFDPSALVSEDISMPDAQRVVASRRWDVNPFVDILRDLVNRPGAGKQVRVPAIHAKEVASGVRDAAEKLTTEGVGGERGVGARVVFIYTGDDGAEVRSTRVADLPTDDREVSVLYTTRERRRHLTPEDRAHAQLFGETFLTKDGKVNGKVYLDWVDAGQKQDENGNVIL